MKPTFLLFLLSAAALSCSSTPPRRTPSTEAPPRSAVVDLSSHFAGLEGAFVLYDQNADTYLRHNPNRCAVRLSPCSTFKIPNTLIALDTGVATGADFVLPWDPQRDPAQPWWQEMGLDWARNHTLASGLQNSVVWYYRELARRIGEPRMKAYLARFRYGNQDISGGLDEFWLTSSLTISADEQVEFLRRLHSEKLGVSHAATATLEQILVKEQGDGYVLRAKTGSAFEAGQPALGWLVGWVEAKDNVYVFALHVTGPEFSKVRATRDEASRGILRELGAIPSQPATQGDLTASFFDGSLTGATF